MSSLKLVPTIFDSDDDSSDSEKGKLKKKVAVSDYSAKEEDEESQDSSSSSESVDEDDDVEMDIDELIQLDFKEADAADASPRGKGGKGGKGKTKGALQARAAPAPRIGDAPDAPEDYFAARLAEERQRVSYALSADLRGSSGSDSDGGSDSEGADAGGGGGGCGGGEQRFHTYEVFANDRPAPSLPDFAALGLSHALLRALDAYGWRRPTPVQAAAAPYVLAGRDVSCSAPTGVGKTGAFAVPLLERLRAMGDLHGGPHGGGGGGVDGGTRVLVLSPTRELAAQTAGVLGALGAPLGVSVALLAGGEPQRREAALLAAAPPLLVATPGRLLDHIENTRGFELSSLEVLVLDEADRLLDAGFAPQVDALLRALPARRQTLLFSATMTDAVRDLARLQLRRGVRVSLAPLAAASGVRQELCVAARGRRLAALVCLLTSSFARRRCLVFFPTRRQAHGARALLALLGVACDELHADRTASARTRALQAFADGRARVLCASDVAARGLDVDGVGVVVNYRLPADAVRYVHRVGRTARWGRRGTAVALVERGDARDAARAQAVASLAAEQGQPLHARELPEARVERCLEAARSMAPKVAQLLREERAEKEMDRAEQEARRAENRVRHQEEILGRPKKTWFQSERQKRAVKEATKREHLEAELRPAYETAVAKAAGGGGGGGNAAKKRKAAKEQGRFQRKMDRAQGERKSAQRAAGGAPAKSSKQKKKAAKAKALDGTTMFKIKAGAKHMKKMERQRGPSAAGKLLPDGKIDAGAAAARRKKKVGAGGKPLQTGKERLENRASKPKHAVGKKGSFHSKKKHKRR